MRLGQGADGLTLANVHVSYTPASLKAGRVNAVRLDGLHLACSYDGERFRLPVLDMLPASEKRRGGSRERARSGPASGPADPARRCPWTARSTAGPWAVPVNAEITPGETVTFTAELAPRDQAVHVEGALGPTLDALSLTVHGGRAESGRVQRFPAPAS